MESLFCENANDKYLWCALDVFSKCVWVKILKDKKGKTVLSDFIETVKESNRKPNKLWVYQGRKCYNKLMQKLLENHDTLMCSTHNGGKSLIAESFRKASKSKIYKKMTANDSKSYLPYLNKLVDQYNNTYHHSINKKPVNTDYSVLTEKIETNPKLCVLIMSRTRFWVNPHYIVAWMSRKSLLKAGAKSEV